MKRMFIGIKILPGKKLLDFYSKLKSELKEDEIKWVPPENMHITLKFLGDTNAALIPIISGNLREIANEFEPFSIDIQGLGCFKKHRKTNVIWLGLTTSNMLNNLAKRIEIITNDFDIKSESRRFKAHLTLGRVKYVSNEKRIAELINIYQDTLFQNVLIEKFFLIESVLQKSGSKYSVISEIVL